MISVVQGTVSVCNKKELIVMWKNICFKLNHRICHFFIYCMIKRKFRKWWNFNHWWKKYPNHGPSVRLGGPHRACNLTKSSSASPTSPSASFKALMQRVSWNPSDVSFFIANALTPSKDAMPAASRWDEVDGREWFSTPRTSKWRSRTQKRRSNLFWDHFICWLFNFLVW